MAPNISQRKFIKWADEPAHEDTTTIVLTSSKGFYVDIRLLLNPPPSSPALQTLQWGFAGTAESYSNEDGSRHTTWTHFVDNKSKTPEKDAGDMWEQADGDTLEKGEMAHPITGKIVPYQELWRDLDIEGPLEGTGEKSKVCVVLKLDEPQHDAKGMIIRIGGRIQGVLRISDKFDVRVWKFDSSDGGQWRKTTSFAKASPLAIATVLFQVIEADFEDEGAFIEGGRVVAKDEAEAEDPEFLSLDSNRGWQVVEKFFY